MADNKNKNVVVAFFKDEATAQTAIEALKSWDEADDDVKLGAIGTIVKEGDKIKTHVPHKIGKGATVGAAVGIIAGVLTGGIGLLGGVVAGGALGGVTGAFLKQDVNLDKTEIERIGEQLDAGNVAVVVACDDYEVDPTREQLKSYDGDVWEYAVTKEAMQAAEDYVTRVHHVSSSIQMTASEAAETAEEAYTFAYPMMENYRTMLGMAVLEDTPSYRAPFNEFYHSTELADASFTDVVRPNNDTLYSTLWLDLRSEPMVLSVPEVPDDRYYAFQMVDLYTHNFAYVGTRATGNEPGKYLSVGPYWQGKLPEGIDEVFRSEGYLVLCLGRTAVDGSDDLLAARAIMEQYQITPLSEFLEAFSGSPKIRPTSHPDCAFGTYFFISPDKKAYPFPRVLNVEGMFWEMSRLAARIRDRGRATWLDKLRAMRMFKRHFRADSAPPDLTLKGFLRSLRGMIDKNAGRGKEGQQTYKTLLCAGMHFQDRYNFDVERTKRCVILYSTPDGVFPFCTWNCGPEYRGVSERKFAAQPAEVVP
jgi:uncharacterized membrane protein